MNFLSVADIKAALGSPGLTSRDLFAAWQQRQPAPEPARDGGGDSSAAEATKQIAWLQSGLALAVEFAGHALEKGELLLACDCAREALRLWHNATAGPDDHVLRVRLRMHYAAALARLGYTSDARKQLEPCALAGFQPPLDPSLKADILMQLGDILREESICAPLRAARDQIAARALDYYRRALEADPERLEAMALVAAAAFTISRPGSDTRLLAAEHANEVLVRARKLETAALRYPLTYFRAVAQAVLGLPDEAAASFGELAGLPDATTPRLADARYWARTLADTLELPTDFFRPAFPPLPLIVFSGHLPDHLGHPERASRFAPTAVGAVRDLLARALEAARANVGMASAAAGADLLFVEALRKREGASFHLVLPWDQDEFRRTSVLPFEPAAQQTFWQPMFDAALAQATTLRVIGQVYQPTDPAALNFTMEVSAGLALHAARTLRLDIHPMALWDGQRGHIAGGTDCFVALWQHLGYEPTILEPPRPALQPVDGVPAPPALAGAGRSSPDRCERDTLRQEVKTLLFADIVGYSKLNETAIPQFVGIFLEAVSALTASSPWAPRYVNTWGDAICAVFDYAQHAGCYAMELIQLIRDRKEDWIEQGLCSTHTLADGTIEKHPLDIRVGLHTGPVFLHYNPMVRQLAFTGAHVNRAARIEPVTPPGEVFASEEFAALVELDRTRQKHRATPAAGTHDGQALSFLCEYAGSLSLAKGYPGRHRLYRVAPHRVFALEELAKAIHEDYCAAEARKGKTARESPSMEPWAALPEMLRDSNRAQAADIPHKLEALGYELAPSFGLSPAEIVISDEQAAELSAEEHERWMQEKRRGGWTYGPVRDNERKLHPSMIPWEELCEEEKDKDRAAVRNVPRLVEKAGFRLSKINRPG